MSAPGDYAEFVRERQSDLLRAAYLVSGDAGAGRSMLVDALAELARHWHRVRDERPDAFVRRGLYDRALSAFAAGTVDVAGAVVDSDVAGSPGPAGDLWEGEVATRRHDVMRALAGLTPLQRAVLVDRYLEHRCDAETEEVLGLDALAEHTALGAALQHLAALGPVADAPRAGSADTRDDQVWSLLELGADEVVEEDLVEEAWELAARRRHRVARRVVLGVLAAGAVGVGAAVVAERDSRRAEDARRAAAVALPTTEVAGTRVVLAPHPGEEPSLPPYSGAGRLGLPERLAPDAMAGVAWTDAPPDVPIAAVLLPDPHRKVGLQVVLDVPVGQPFSGLAAYVRPADRVQVRGHLSTRTISNDRRRVVLPCAAGVVVVDGTDHSVTCVPVPDVCIRVAGWACDDRTVVAASRSSGWVVDPGSASARPVSLPVCPDREDLGEPGADLAVLTFTDEGVLSGSREVTGLRMIPSGESPSAANDAGWVAGEVFLCPECREATGRGNGLAVVPPGDPADPIVLATSPERGDGHRFKALRWATPSTLLLESRSYDAGWRRRILAWDVRSDLMWRVAEVEPSSAAAGFTGIYAI